MVQLVGHNCDTICWGRISHRNSYYTFGKNVCTNFEVLISYESEENTHMPQLRHNVADQIDHHEICFIA